MPAIKELSFRNGSITVVTSAGRTVTRDLSALRLLSDTQIENTLALVAKAEAVLVNAGVYVHVESRNPLVLSVLITNDGIPAPENWWV